MIVSQEFYEISKILSYNPNTGEITWKYRPDRSASWNSQWSNKLAGTRSKQGYIRVQINGKNMHAHRVSWLLFHGAWPEKEIDHINRIRSDNRIVNLRQASHRQNLQNVGRQSHNTSGCKGVYWNKSINKWRAQIKTENGLLFLGNFDDKEDAAAAYRARALKDHGKFARFD